MPDESNEFRPHGEQHAVQAIMARVSSWVIPALIGALLTLLFNVSGDRVTTAQTIMRVDKLEVQVEGIKKDLASGGPPALARRVDDLQTQTQEQYREVSKKLDAIQELLIKRR